MNSEECAKTDNNKDGNWTPRAATVAATTAGPSITVSAVSVPIGVGIIGTSSSLAFAAPHGVVSDIAPCGVLLSIPVFLHLPPSAFKYKCKMPVSSMGVSFSTSAQNSLDMEAMNYSHHFPICAIRTIGIVDSLSSEPMYMKIRSKSNNDSCILVDMSCAWNEYEASSASSMSSFGAGSSVVHSHSQQPLSPGVTVELLCDVYPLPSASSASPSPSLHSFSCSTIFPCLGLRARWYRPLLEFDYALWEKVLAMRIRFEQQWMNDIKMRKNGRQLTAPHQENLSQQFQQNDNEHSKQKKRTTQQREVR